MTLFCTFLDRLFILDPPLSTPPVPLLPWPSAIKRRRQDYIRFPLSPSTHPARSILVHDPPRWPRPRKKNRGNRAPLVPILPFACVRLKSVTNSPAVLLVPRVPITVCVYVVNPAAQSSQTFIQTHPHIHTLLFPPLPEQLRFPLGSRTRLVSLTNCRTHKSVG